MTLEKLKALFWPHVAGAMLVLVSVDYLTLAAGFVKIFAAAWLIMQLLAFPTGFVVRALTKFSSASPLANLSKYPVVRLFPLLDAGSDVFDRLFEEPVG